MISKLSRGQREQLSGYVMTLPAVSFIALLTLFPVAYSVFMSLHSAAVDGLGDWVGLENYRRTLSDPVFFQATVNTTVFTIVSVAIEVTLGTLIALGLNQTFRGRGITRAAILVPWAFPVVISALMWRLMFQDQIGIIAYIAQSTGMTSSSILSDQSSLLIAAILADVWKTTPFMALLILAGLQTIPSDVIEAAMVDGAGAVRKFFLITLPLLRPTIVVALLFRTLEAWGVYDLFWVMSDRQLESLSTYVYRAVRVSQLNFATGTAAAVLTFIAALAIAIALIRILNAPIDRKS